MKNLIQSGNAIALTAPQAALPPATACLSAPSSAQPQKPGRAMPSVGCVRTQLLTGAIFGTRNAWQVRPDARTARPARMYAIPPRVPGSSSP